MGRRGATRRRAGGVVRPAFEAGAFLSALGMAEGGVEGVLVCAGEGRGGGDGDGDGDGERGRAVCLFFVLFLFVFVLFCLVLSWFVVWWVVGLRLGPFFYFLTINQSFFFFGGLKWFKFSNFRTQEII